MITVDHLDATPRATGEEILRSTRYFQLSTVLAESCAEPRRVLRDEQNKHGTLGPARIARRLVPR